MIFFKSKVGLIVGQSQETLGVYNKQIVDKAAKFATLILGLMYSLKLFFKQV